MTILSLVLRAWGTVAFFGLALATLGFFIGEYTSKKRPIWMKAVAVVVIPPAMLIIWRFVLFGSLP